MESHLMDRLIAASAAMPAGVYLLGSLIAWYRVIHPAGTNHYVRRITASRAVAWSAFFVLFVCLVLVRTKNIVPSDFWLAVVLILTNLAVLGSALSAARAITFGTFGDRIFWFFCMFSIASGIFVMWI